MSLVVWFPLNNNVNNQGTTTLSMTSLSGSTLSNTGKVTRYCYGNTSFTGGGYVSSQQITLGQNQSIFAWVKFSSLTSDSSLGGSIAGQHRYPSNVGMGMTLKYVSSTTGYLSVNTGNGSARTFNTYCGSTLLQANTWYHLGYTYDGSTIRLYVNGVLDGSHNFTGMSTPTDYFMVGCWSFSGSSGNSVYGNYKLNGYINDLRAYNHTLSMKEIKELSRGLALHYKFNFEDLYVPVEYIQSSGTQYIDTGVVPSTTLRGQVVLKPNTSYISEYSILGSTWSASGYFLMFYQSKIRFHSRNYVYDTTNNATSSKTTIDFYSHNLTTNCLVVNGTAAPNTADYGDTADSANTIHIFDTLNSDKRGRFTLYSCKFYDNDVLVRNFIPCIRKCDSKPGLFDLVNNVFYTNSGTGEFTYPSTTITTTIPDASGYNNAIIPTSVTASNTTNIGTQAVSFTGSSSYLRLAHEVLNGAFSVSVWFKTSSTSNQCLFCDRASTGGGPALFLLNGNSVRFDTVDTSCSASLSYGDGNWHHIVAVYNGSNRYIYIDGTLKTTYATTSLGGLGAVVSIGGSYASSSSTTPNGNYFNGQISDWKLYNTALSQADITELYKTKESIDKKGNLYCNTINELGNSMSFKKSGIIECNSIIEGFNKTSLQGAYTQLDYIDEVNPAAGATSQHNRCDIAGLVYTNIEARVNVTGTGTNGGIMLAGKGGSWWRSWQGSGTGTVTMTPNTLTENTWTNVSWNCGQAYTGLWTSGWSDATNYWTPQHLRIAYIKTYNSSTLTGYFIPVKRNKDNVLGLLNLITNTFYANAGTGSFAAGSEINKKYAIYTNNIIEN